MIIIVGASASGKTELAKILYKKYGYKKCITTTTRSKRVNETDGLDYHFISKSEFTKLLERDQFVEFSTYNKHLYGLQKTDVLDNGIVILDPNGANYLTTKLNNKAYVVFVASDEGLRRKRMISRGDEPKKIEERLIHDSNFYDTKQFIKINLMIENQEEPLEILARTIHKSYQDYIRD